MIPKRQRGFDELNILIVTDNTFTVTPPMVFQIKLYVHARRNKRERKRKRCRNRKGNDVETEHEVLVAESE